MALRDVTLSATESNWRLFMIRKADSAFLTFQEKICARDQHTCQYCGFRTNKHLEVINLNGNYRDNRANNLITACGFCAQCFFMESIGKGEFGGGTLIYLPEMTQSQLNALCHVLFATIVMGSTNASQARNIYRSFKLRAQIVEKQLGEGLSNPALFGRLSVDTKLAKTDFHKEITSNLRLLPDLSGFLTEVVDCLKEGLNELSLVEAG